VSAAPQERSVALAWTAVLALGVGGYATVVAPAEREIRAVGVETASVYGLAERNERVLQRGRAIAAAAARVRRDLAQLRGKTGVGKPTLELLAFLDAESRRRDVSFGGIVPVDSGGRDSGVQRVTLSLNGTYGDVLHVVSELTTQPEIVAIDSVQLSRSARTDGSRTLDASISATLFYREGSIVGSTQR
jgi:hypothetical protein